MACADMDTGIHGGIEYRHPAVGTDWHEAVPVLAVTRPKIRPRGRSFPVLSATRLGCDYPVAG